MNTDTNNRSEDILNSLDGIKRAPVPDFFYTRLMAKMEKGITEKSEKIWKLRPVYAVAVLLLVIIVNALVFLNSSDKTDFVVNENETAQQSIASEYKLNDVTYIYDLNKDR